MILGVPREIMDHEFRVGMTPQGVRELVVAGHQVLIESGAGSGSNITDEDFRRAGARICTRVEDLYAQAEMIVKVKEPQQEEFPLLRKRQILFSFLHLAAHPDLARALLQKGSIGIAYETVQEEDGNLPLLAPMSEVAGRMAPQIGAHYLEKLNGGRGILIGGTTGVPPANVLILGAGIVGTNAAIMATGLEAHVHILDKDLRKLKYLEHILHGRLITLMSNIMNVEEMAIEADLIIGAVLIPGARAPVIISKEVVGAMKPGAVIVDIAIDQGGCCETSRMTTHSDPVYVHREVIHYCVGNVPAAVPRTSTFALTNVTLPYILEIANKGLKDATLQDSSLAKGINVIEGRMTSKPVAESLGLEFCPLEEVLPQLGKGLDATA
jgi:alanine dehydrogenase